MNNFSPNMLKTYQTCPKKYYFRYVENISVPQSAIPFEKGKKIHALANYKLQGIKIDRLETALNSDEKQVWDLLQQNSYYSKECFKSEFALSCRIVNEENNEIYWVGGRIDAIVHDFDKYYILDYKTGSAPKNAKYDFQTMIYLLCLDKYLKNYDSLAFVYIDLKNNRNELIKFSNELKEQYKKNVLEACKIIINDNSYKCNYDNCKYCEYAKICHLSDLTIL